MIFQMIQRLVKFPELCQEPGGVYYFDITKDGKIASKWSQFTLKPKRFNKL
jgi:hypothetical protein